MIIPANRPLQPADEKDEGAQGEDRTDLEESYDGLEIVEQSALDHFNAVLLKAQRTAAKAEKEKPRKRPRQYDGKSKRTLKRHKKYREDLAKQGYLSVFEFVEHVNQRDKKRAHIEQLAAKAIECEQESESEESVPQELDTKESSEDLVFECVGQVRCKEVLMR
jgi:hypothetical protein